MKLASGLELDDDSVVTSGIENPMSESARTTRLVNGLRELAVLARRAVVGKPLREEIIRRAAELFEADSVALWRAESRERVWRIAATHGLSRDYSSIAIPMPTYKADDILPGPVLVPDVTKWSFVEDRRNLYEHEGIRSFLVIPLHIRGETAGTITIYYRSSVTSVEPVVLDTAATFGEIASLALSTERFDQLGEVANDVAGRLDLEAVVQRITDAATMLTGAHFGAFFYNVIRADGEAYTLYTISGVPRSHFEKFPMPRNTQIFEPTFSGRQIVRSGDITRDPRYGKNEPYFGMPKGHLPVVSYLAVPVRSRTGEVIGGLFFGHPEAEVFGETEEKIAVALAGHAAVAIDNVRLYQELEDDRAAVRREERRYRSLVLATPSRQAIVLIDRNGRLQGDFSSWRAITGQTLEELEGDGWLDAIHPAHRQRVSDEWAEAIANRTIFESKYLLRQSDGAYRWYADRTVPIFGDDGELEEWVGTTVDVHDQHVAREGLEFLSRANEILATSLDYRETLKNLTRLAVPEIADWCAVHMSNATSDPPLDQIALAHVDPDKIALARSFYEKYPPDPETSGILRVIRTGVSELVPALTDEMLQAGARSPEHLEMMRGLGLMSYMTVPLRTRGSVIGAITFVASDRRFDDQDLRLAEELANRASIAIENARLYTAAQAANTAKDEFLATLSHELRTPMTAVLGWARMLKLGLDEEEARAAVEAIEKNATVQAQLIEDVLDVSRIISGKLSFEPRPVDLRISAEAAVATVYPAARARGIELLTSIPPALPSVAGDEGRLQQIIWNLLSNAVKFTPRGGSITLRLTADDSNVRVIVSDTGEGIEREFLPFVFEPFRQADSSSTRNHGGIGLGLAIVRTLVELHGGRITVESEGHGHGATFTLELPIMDLIAIPAAQRESPADASPVQDQLTSLIDLTALVIDDQEDMRNVVGAILRRSGAAVHAAASTQEGLQALRNGQFDFVVCDIAMPREDGYAFLHAMRSMDSPSRSIPVVALTAFGRPEDRLHALEAGFDAYLKKPVDPVELTQTLGTLRSKSGNVRPSSRGI